MHKSFACFKALTFYCSNFDIEMCRTNLWTTVVVFFWGTNRIYWSLIINLPKDKNHVKVLRTWRYLIYPGVSRGMRKNIVVFFSFSEDVETKTAGNNRVSSACNFLLCRFIPPRSKTSPTDWRMDSSSPPVWGRRPYSCTLIHTIDSQQALCWREERRQYLIYED